MTEIAQYAPVCIPTLNRYEHFMRCLESLERCTGADKTVVYVGLDYPPSDKYVKGWKKIDAYLIEKEKKNGFKNLIVRRRDHNCGVGVINSNSALLIREIEKKYDWYIFTEDDNEFSPNFLLFINKALNKYKNDDNIYCVCGYNRRIVVPETFDGNYYLAHDFVAWGVGYWTKKLKHHEYRSFDYLMSILRDKKKYSLLKKESPQSIRNIVVMLKLRKFHGDVLINVYEALEGKYSVFPVISKVRNHGNDGTGVHSKVLISDLSNYFSEQEIDDSKGFEFMGGGPIQPSGIQVVSYEKPAPLIKRVVRHFILQIDLFLIRHFGIVLKSMYI